MPGKGIRTYEQGAANNIALGQGGSAFLDTNATTFTPAVDYHDGAVVVAITALTDCAFDALVAEGGTGKYVNTVGAGAGGDTLADDGTDEIPKGVTIFGRWTRVSVQADGQKCICYVG